ncbi:MAG: TIGR01777 family protein [Gammaproteobacteria bacterium]|nr:TIGR01777 family protein [Gammaproteobacteria bacterium]MBC55149.1 TIGR01777 family protein [Gammaproteobacteria bacterium]|tara:strand:- start:1132 stop:2046 length:915 start_codon:yes stop_codon:yes gene_type:complete
MRILITGGTGFIGARLAEELQAEGHELTVLVRDYARARLILGTRPELLRSLDEVDQERQFDAIINLAGAGIADKRWTAARKRLLLNSRLQTTKALIKLCQRLRHRPQVLLSASAVGFYGAHGTEPLTETSPVHDEFSHQLCKRWEEEARKAESLDIRVCLMRFGVVLGPGGGMLGRLLPMFRLALGGRLGDGQQMLSWVHRADVIKVMRFLLASDAESGVFNVTAPDAVNNATFTRELAAAVNRPAVLPLPAPLVQLMFGEMGDRLLLHGQNVKPARLQALGFDFKYPDLRSALAACLCDSESN